MANLVVVIHFIPLAGNKNRRRTNGSTRPSLPVPDGAMELWIGADDVDEDEDGGIGRASHPLERRDGRRHARAAVEILPRATTTKKTTTGERPAGGVAVIIIKQSPTRGR